MTNEPKIFGFVLTRIENIVEKEEGNPDYLAFYPFLVMISETFSLLVIKNLQRFNCLPCNFEPLERKAFKNIVGKGENAGNKFLRHLLHHLQMLSVWTGHKFC